MSDINQDDIDKLLQDALAGGDDDPVPAPPQPQENLGGAASQDDIDALFAAVGVNPEDASAAAPASAAPKPEPSGGWDGVANQDDIDALFSAVGGGATEAAPQTADDTAAADQNDVDSLLAAIDQRAKIPENAQPDANHDLDALLSSVDDEAMAEDDGKRELDGDIEDISLENKTVGVDDFDMEEMFRQVTDAVTPPPPSTPAQPESMTPIKSDTAKFDLPSIADTVQDFRLPEMAQEPSDAPPPAPTPTAFPSPHPSVAPIGQQQEFSVLHGAGEVESVANQISTLIATLSEKAHRYMQAWLTSDSEAKELRSRALAEERRRAAVASERDALSKELDEMRKRVGELEGGKIAAEESKRTMETSYQAKVRELGSQVKLLTSEVEGLKDELTRSRNQATGVDIESRRARFEADRLKNEVESERMERLRIQRALENREKEIQAVQAQTAGQASSLFIDELHRLVRRLETELETRSSGAYEALKQLDRLEASEDLVPPLSNLRAALMQAIGAEADGDDALKALGREAFGVKGPAAVAQGKTEMLSFETSLSTYNLTDAMDIAGALLREAKARPSSLMRKIYQCPALRRPEIADYLGDLSRLLEGLRTVQESSDRSRGSESGESEVFYVQMFDFLHNLVRLKLVNRLSGDIWRLFLDLRGRFSFVTSDKQWAEYRDKTLDDNKG